MTRQEIDNLRGEIASVIEIINVNKALEYMVFVHDNYLTDQEKRIIDIDGLMLHASKQSEEAIRRLDSLDLTVRDLLSAEEE